MRPAVDLDRFEVAITRQKPAAANGATGDGHGAQPLRVLYAGTVGLAHGLGTLLDAARELDSGTGSNGGGPTQVAVTIAGDGADAPALRARLAAAGPPSVRMLGAVPAADIPSLYAASDVAVVMLRDLPIFEGALPTKMLEAMAAGRPVVLGRPRRGRAPGRARALRRRRPARGPARAGRGAGGARRRPRPPRRDGRRRPRRRRARLRPRGLAGALARAAAQRRVADSLGSEEVADLFFRI